MHHRPGRSRMGRSGRRCGLGARLTDLTLEEDGDLRRAAVMGVGRFDLTRSAMRVKRALDLLGAALGLLALSPLLLVIAAAIKLDGRGAVLYRQLRVGRHGKRFHMLKFRTMVPDADAMKDALRVATRRAGASSRLPRIHA